MKMEQQSLWDKKDEGPITVEELEQLCKTAALQRDVIKKMEEEVKEEKAKLSTLKNEIKDQLVKLDKRTYKSDHGTVYIQTKFSIKTPKTEEEKKAFFDWCKEKEIYWQYATVNSTSLNSLYKSMLESEGVDFEMPGVAEPTSFDELRMRKS